MRFFHIYGCNLVSVGSPTRTRTVNGQFLVLASGQQKSPPFTY